MESMKFQHLLKRFKEFWRGGEHVSIIRAPDGCNRPAVLGNHPAPILERHPPSLSHW
jgi:hypothetical protein